MSHYIMNFADCWADLRKGVKAARADYLKKVERATPYLPSEKAKEDIEAAKADYEAALESVRGAARPRFARAIEGMKERIAAPDMTAPTQDMLSILTMLNMRDDIEAGEIEAAAKAKGAGFDHTFTVSVHNLIGQQLTGAEKDRGSVQLTWISDIRLNKDGKSIFGVPSKYAEVMEDGSVLPAPRDISDIAEQENTVANRNGIRFYRLGGDEENNKATSKDRDLYTDGGIIKLEKAYLPNRLPMKYLVKEAEMRSPEEEQRLNENDIAMLGIDRLQKAAHSRAMRNNQNRSLFIDIRDACDGRSDAMIKLIQIFASIWHKIVTIGERRIFCVARSFAEAKEDLLQSFFTMQGKIRDQLCRIAGSQQRRTVDGVETDPVLVEPFLCGLCLFDACRCQGRVALALIDIHDIE